MSTPTSREPDEHRADATPEPVGTTGTGPTAPGPSGDAAGPGAGGTGDDDGATTGVHAAPRAAPPAPAPPAPIPPAAGRPDPVPTPAASAEPGAGAPAQGPPIALGSHAAPTPVDTPPRRETLRERTEARELPERPRKPGLGRHLLGILLGFVLTPVAVLLTGIGTARLADLAVVGDPVTDPLGITLLVVGVLILAVVVLLGAWSPAVPITGGLVWGIALGLAFLVNPAAMEDSLEAVSADRVVPGGIEQLAQDAMSGTLLVTGTLLVAAGIAAARARRRGRRWAEGVAAAEAAQLEARNAEHRAP